MKTTAPLAAALFALECLAGRDRFSPKNIAADIKTSGLRANLVKLNKIAEEHGGNRAFGLPGYKASVDFILRETKRYKKSIKTWVQPFNHTFEQTRELTVTGPDGEEVHAITLLYNPPTPAEGITALLIDTTVNDEDGSMCTEQDWEAIDATGKLALVKRGVCPIADKLRLAKSKGALGVILYNQEPGTSYQSATIGAENRHDVIPTGLIPLEVGTKWKADLADGKEIEVRLLVDSIFEERETWNVFAETREGDPDNVIFLGAHLDSVQAGPGINDDGSGTTALLEIMKSFAQHRGFKNKVRFGWWGAEESGLIGSLYYTSQLSSEEADKIRYYFNYDMIGSPNPSYIIYDGEEIGSTKLHRYLEKAGMPASYGAFGSSSDYVGFLDIGVPSSGIFTGASPEEDPCYHQACDTIDNIHWDALTINARAAAHTAAEFALSLNGVPLRNHSTTPIVARRSDDDEGDSMGLMSWESLLARVAPAVPCSHQHDHDNVY